MVDSINIADSKWNESSTGNINFYLQKSDPLFANLKKKNAVSAIFSNETKRYNNETEQMDAVGYRVLVTGSVAQVKKKLTLKNLLVKIDTIKFGLRIILDSNKYDHV